MSIDVKQLLHKVIVLEIVNGIVLKLLILMINKLPQPILGEAILTRSIRLLKTCNLQVARLSSNAQMHVKNSMAAMASNTRLKDKNVI